MVSIFSNTCFKPWLWKKQLYVFFRRATQHLQHWDPLRVTWSYSMLDHFVYSFLVLPRWVYILHVCPVLLVQFSKQKAYYKYCTVKLLRSIYRPEYIKRALLKGRSLVTCKRLISSSWKVHTSYSILQININIKTTVVIESWSLPIIIQYHTQ